MSTETTYLRNPDVALRDEDASGSLLFNPDTGEVLVINDTGRFIWDLCAESITMKAIVGEFNKAYEDIPEALPEDVDEFISTMTKGGFLASK
jgi:hypothetical protein